MIIIAILLNIVLISFDQLLKRFAVLNLKPDKTLILIDGILELSYVENRGAAFGFMQGGRIFFVIFTAIVLCGIIYYFIKLPKTKVNIFLRVALILVSAGAIGNLIDRASQGYVVDCIKATFIDFPVFNMADVYVVTGTLMFAIIIIFFVKEEEHEEEH